MDLAAQLDLAAAAAREAGARLRELAAVPRAVLSAEGRDIKLIADLEAEDIILARLSAGSPFPILSEEAGGPEALGDGPFWVVDPLDGTLNFSRAIPIAGVSLGLVEGDRPLLGAIYDFQNDELFTGLAAGGAWLNGVPIRASATADPADAILATGLPTFSDFSPESLTRLVQLCQSFKSPRMIGSAALALAWTACGRADAYAEEEIRLWDVAAGVAIVLGAGRRVDKQPSPPHRWGRRVRAAGRASLWTVTP